VAHGETPVLLRAARRHLGRRLLHEPGAPLDAKFCCQKTTCVMMHCGMCHLHVQDSDGGRAVRFRSRWGCAGDDAVFQGGPLSRRGTNKEPLP